MNGVSDLTILFEDGEALVIDKPGGLPLDRPRAGGRSLEDHLGGLRFGFAREPSPVHRLDQDTSGCLLLARNPKALKRFGAAFEARLVEKVYLGVVAGAVEGEDGTISIPLGKVSTREDGWRMVPMAERHGQTRRVRQQGGKPAVTHWRRIAEIASPQGPLTLVEFRPETGRTHQIRVHAAEGLGAALLGDPVYGDGVGARRTLLHAAALTVPREGKPPVQAVAPFPADFSALGFGEPSAED